MADTQRVKNRGSNLSIKRGYWLCQIIGWTTYIICGVTMSSIINGNFRVSYLNTYLFSAFTFLLITHFSRYWFKRKKVFEKKLHKILLIMMGFVISATILGVGLVYSWMGLIEQSFEWVNISALYISSVNTAITFTVWISLYAGFKVFTNYRKNEVKKWKLEAKLLETEISALKAQINPHFVFNALNNIRSLISENPQKARKAVTTLSKLLRISMRFEDELVIPLKKELKIVKEYLHMESLHLEKRLQVFWNLSPVVNTYHIPALGIQTLVENAIKHGISTTPDGGILRIATQEEDDKLWISVFNTGQLTEMKSKKSNGTGLKNLTKRLKLFDERSQFHIEEYSNNTVKAEIVIHSK